MSLRKLKNPVPQRDVALSDGESFSVRGLSPASVLGIYQRHTGQVSDIFEEIVGRFKADGDVDPHTAQELLVRLLSDAPDIMAEIIAAGMGIDPRDETQVPLYEGSDVTATVWAIETQLASQLVFPVQLDALMKIGELTFTSEMPLKKFAALVIGALNKMAPLPTN